MVERLSVDRLESPEFLDTVYVILADASRRNALQYLLTRRDRVPVFRLAAEIAALERGIPSEDVTADQQYEAFLELQHVHLPMLSESGVVEWDRVEENVTVTPILDLLSQALPDPTGILDVSALSETVEKHRN
ncbi:hypothetical protein Htur_4234 (plasmid) [Haloterrigena turkmenica DSM 5511]|uniref:DUF7344 domain-containing protein n=1 Tax=Haloterrigena turkmenica (strain ATCC 51198 / DSM 5511 / JCM 9101 / NCIMB 13204 / VKM B-1734 / 4k) TaxID=543526 RepID=D2S107_HALTV|nr:hypothetical protein [Haloterrigena turkmenica]ADB63054.1 hypothetical protein Htur_4234 [Haloterrigena turkmenica DSM 5511]